MSDTNDVNGKKFLFESCLLDCVFNLFQDDPFYICREWLSKTSERKMRRGPWVGVAFAYGGAIGSFMRHRDKYLATILLEELIKFPKVQIEKLFEKLGLVSSENKFHSRTEY